MARKADARRKPDTRRFVQVAESPSLGVEVTTGQAWVGVDQQVGHGSADALFALTADEYAVALESSWSIRELMGECWSGLRPERLLFHPGGGAWEPAGWVPRRPRMLRQAFEGELWWHLDALGQPRDSVHLERSTALAGGSAQIVDDEGGVRSMALRLVGDGAYPRPGALIAGLRAGSSREDAHIVLGTPAPDDLHHVEGVPVRLEYVDDGLASITLERATPAPTPAGAIRTVLAAIGGPEEGSAFHALAQLAGGTSQRWAVSSAHPRRLLAFDGGIDVQVEDDRVLSVRVDLDARSASAGAAAADLVADVSLPATRSTLRAALGQPAASDGTTDLHRFADAVVLVEHDGSDDDTTATAITAVLPGVFVSPHLHRWRSGDVFRFVDILGRPPTNPLVEHVRARPGVRLRLRAGVVDAVEVAVRSPRTERLIDGMPPRPTRRDLQLGRPSTLLERDDLYDLDRGWLHVHASDGTTITSITVCAEPPRHLDVDRYVPPADRGAWAPDAS